MKNSDGVTIYYVITSSNEVAVTYKDDNYLSKAYSGSVKIPSVVDYNNNAYSVTYIVEKAFYRCSGMTSVTIPNSVTSIGDYAFDGCTSMSSVTILESVTSIGEGAFFECSSMSSVTIPNSVTSIGSYAFYCCSDLTSVTIPNSVKLIDYRAFHGCVGLTSVTIPESVTYIGSGAFCFCRGLTSVTIPNSVTSIGSEAFSKCSGLTSVTIPNSVKSIGERAFSDCTGLTTVTIPESVKSIGERAFIDCSGLTEVTIPESVTSIGGSAFKRCTNLETVNFNAVNCKEYDYSVFDNCGKLSTINIGNKVTTIPACAFYNCSGLTEVTIPESVTSIGGSAFKECTNLETVNFNAENCIEMGSSASPVFYGCGKLSTLNIGNKVTTIPAGAFYGCNSLTSVVFPNTVTSVGYEAFYNCSSLTSLTIPLSLTSIGYDAFANCTGLAEVKVYNPQPSEISLGHIVFRNVPTSTCILYVPMGSKALYAEAAQWMDFVNMEEIAPDNYLITNDLSVSPEDNVDIAVEMNNIAEIIAFKCDIVIPSCFSLIEEDEDYEIRLSDRASKNHSVYIEQVGDDTFRVVSFYKRPVAFSGNNGVLFYLPILASARVSECDIEFKNIELTDINENLIYSPDFKIHIDVERRIGDANGDGKVSIVDIVAMCNYILGDVSVDFSVKASDINGDGVITVVDVVGVVNLIMSAAETTVPDTPSSEYKVDFNSFNGGVATSRYSSYTNSTGWTAQNALIISGTTGGDNNPYFQFIGGEGVFGVVLNGKSGAAGVLTSPTLSGGIKTLTFNYGFPYVDTKCKFTVKILQGDKVVKEDVVDLNTIEKMKVYTYKLTGINVSGSFKIVIENNAKGGETANKERVAIWNLTLG